MLDKVTLIICQLGLPLESVRRKINFIGGPKRSNSLLVHVPYGLALQGKEDKPRLGLFAQERHVPTVGFVFLKRKLENSLKTNVMYVNGHRIMGRQVVEDGGA